MGYLRDLWRSRAAKWLTGDVKYILPKESKLIDIYEVSSTYLRGQITIGAAGSG